MAHIRTKYPKVLSSRIRAPLDCRFSSHLFECVQPWSEETEKLIAFLLAVESHDQADVDWHWGPQPAGADDQGFLHAMSHSASWCKDQWNTGVEPICHTIGDTGGDLLLAYRGNLNWKDWTNTWLLLFFLLSFSTSTFLES